MIRFGVPPIGGQEWFGGWMYMRNLVRSLALYGDADIETCVFVGSDREHDSYIEELRGLPHTRVVVDAAFDSTNRGSGGLKTLATGRRAALLDIFRREKVDVAFDPATYYGWRCEIPTIAWIPDFQHRALPHLFGKLAWYRRETGFRLQIATSSKILLSSSTAEGDCHAYYPSSLGKTHVARFAVPVDDWPEPVAAERLLKSAEIPQDFVFLPNQLWHHKNHALAIDAASILARRGSGRSIVATGRGSDPRRPNYRTELVGRITTSGAASHFILLDGVDHALVKAMMMNTTALLNPSLFEGWSTTVEEAKAAGTPMLLSDLPVHREQAPSAVFFPPHDPQTLAELIDKLPVRSKATIRTDMRKATLVNLEHQKEFSKSIITLIREAAAL